MITTNLTTLKINKLTKAQYEAALAAGNINENELYMTPEEDGNLANHTLITIPAGRMRGDIDGDGKLTQADVDLLSAYVFDPNTTPLDDTQLLCADINENGSINGTDTLQLRQYLANTKKAGQFGAEVTGNWTNNPNYATEEGQFYTDVTIDGMTANNSASVLVKGMFENGFFTKAECIEGAVRIYAKLCPISALTAVVSWGSGNGTAVITTESNKSEIFIAEYGTTTSAEIEAAYQAGKLVLCKQNTLIYTLTKRTSETWHSFSGHISKNAIRYVTCNADVWSYEQPKFLPDALKGGDIWTQSNITDIAFYSVYNANGLWVAGSGNGLYYSTDSKTWTQSNITSGYFYMVYNANGIWVTGSGSGSKGLYYSTDGITWTQSNITSGMFSSVYYTNGIWVAGGSNGNGLYYSTDGKTWTKSNITSVTFRCVYNTNGIWVAGSDSKGLYYSTDGKTWTQSNITNITFYCVYYANSIWVAGSYNKGLYYSTDGMTWTQSNITSNGFYCVYYANGIWVAGSYNGKGLYYSTDGKTWTQSNITGITFNCVYYTNGIWVACSGSGNHGLYYSTDGKTWTQSNITDIAFYSVYYANGIWVAGSNSGNGLYYSLSDINKILTVDSYGNANWEAAPNNELDTTTFLRVSDVGSAVDTNPINADTLGGKSASEYLTNSDIVDALTITKTDKALSANQGKVLNDSINSVANSVNTFNSTVNTKAPIANPAFTGTATVAAGTNYTTAKLRNIVLSTANPSGGNNGDIWIKYTE